MWLLHIIVKVLWDIISEILVNHLVSHKHLLLFLKLVSFLILKLLLILIFNLILLDVVGILLIITQVLYHRVISRLDLRFTLRIDIRALKWDTRIWFLYLLLDYSCFR